MSHKTPVQRGSRTGSVRYVSTEIAALYARIIEGDADAFDVLYTRHKDLVWWVIRNAGVFGADAEDVFQATWAKFIEFLGRHRDPKALNGWLVAVARNQCIDLGRIPGPHVALDLLADLQSDEVAPDEAAIRGLDGEMLERAMAQLSERERQLVALWAHGASYREIDETLGFPAGSVGPTLGRCRAKLEKVMKERS